MRGVNPLLALVACACSGTPTDLPPDPSCGGYADWQISAYVLPYRVGTSHRVVQGNCTSPQSDGWNSHQASGPWAYAYDFRMPVRTDVVAARGGTVIYVEERRGDKDKEHGNSLLIRHDDGTYAGYGHLSQHRVLVAVDQVVSQGDLIALSGESGSPGSPHLHFQVSPCSDMDTLACKSIPVTFRNTSPNPKGLQRGEAYEAFP